MMRNKLYGTTEVAHILDVPEWRVKNYSQGRIYGLPFAQLLGEGGPGSRRLYTLAGLLRIAIADSLVGCGFTPRAVGKALLEIRESRLFSWVEHFHKKGSGQAPLLLCVQGKWSVLSKGKARELVDEALDDDWRGLFVLNFPSLLDSVIRRVGEIEGHANRTKSFTKEKKA